MLSAMRDGAHSKFIKSILFSFLILAALGMAMMDVGGFFTNGGVSNNAIAKVGRDSIGVTQFDNSVRRIVAQQGMSPQEAYQFGMVDQILEQQLTSMLISQNAHKLGLTVSDKQVAEQINKYVAPLQKDGMTKKDILQRLLQNQGMGEAEFISNIRSGIMASLVQNTLQSAATLPGSAETRAVYMYRNEKRTIEGFILRDDSVKDIEKAPEEVLKSLYEASKALRYTIPEERTFKLAILTKEDVAGVSAITDEELRKEYDINIAAYTVPERRSVEQASATTEADANKLIEDVKSGKKLKDVAKSSYQAEQTYDRAGMEQAMADAVFSASENQPVGPFKSPLGWTVMVVKKTLPEEIKSFSSVKADLKKQMAELKSADDLFNTANAIDDRLASGEELESIVSEMKLRTVVIGPVRIDGSTSAKTDAMKEFEKDSQAILQSAFEMNEGEAAPVQEISGGRYAVVRVDAIKEKSFQPYDDVREDLAKGWANDQRGSANKSRALQAQQDVASGKQSLSVLASGFGAKVETFKSVKRTGEPPKGLDAAAIQRLFDAAPGETIATPVPGGYLIATVKSLEIPDPDKIDEKDLAEISSSLTTNMGNDIAMSYMKHLREETRAKINRRLLETLYGPESGQGS